MNNDGLIGEFINKLLLAIQQLLASVTDPWLQPLLDWFYIAGWWGAATGILILALLISWFVPFTTIRVIAGWIVSLAFTAAIAATVVFKRMKAVQDKLKKIKRR